MKKSHIAAALLLFPALAFADGAELTAVKQKNRLLESLSNTCMITGRTAYVKMRYQQSMEEEAQALEKCIADGKESAKKAHAEIKSIFQKKSIPAELTEWRLEWMAVFDATALKTGEVENQYLRRVQEARSKVERATNKFEMSLE